MIHAHEASRLEYDKNIDSPFEDLKDSTEYLEDHWFFISNEIRKLCEDKATRPSFVLADYMAPSFAYEIGHIFKIHFAVFSPHLPFYLIQSRFSLIPSEIHIDFFFAEKHRQMFAKDIRFISPFYGGLIAPLGLHPQLFHHIVYMYKLSRRRQEHRTAFSFLTPSGPRYMVLANTFFPLDQHRDLRPSLIPVGPVLNDATPISDQRMAFFIQTHTRIALVRHGMSISCADATEDLVAGLLRAVEAGYIDGVIATVPEYPIIEDAYSVIEKYSWFQQLDTTDSRAVLDHPHTKLLVCDGTPYDTLEAVVHGKPMIVIPVFIDQRANTSNLRKAGVALYIDPDTLTPHVLCESIGKVLSDRNFFLRKAQEMADLAGKAGGCRSAVDQIEKIMYSANASLSSILKHIAAVVLLLGVAHVRQRSARMCTQLCKTCSSSFFSSMRRLPKKP